MSYDPSISDLVGQLEYAKAEGKNVEAASLRAEITRRQPRPNLFAMSVEDEAMVRDHHATDGGYERCIICRLLATLDYEREERARS